MRVVSLGVLATATGQSNPGDGGLEEAQRRNRRLLFERELADGTITMPALDTPRVRSVTVVRPIAHARARRVQNVRRRLGLLDFHAAVERPLLAARHSVLGADAKAPPRFLIRVDEYPHAKSWGEPERYASARFSVFHDILASAEVPYLLAVLPRVSRDPLCPSASEWRPLLDHEIALLQRLGREQVSVGLHGLNHRTRFASPRRRSELSGLEESDVDRLLGLARAELAQHGLRTDVLVPPFNRFDAEQLSLLTRRFAVVCGGPESIACVGFHMTPHWRAEGVYLPAYSPFYGRAEQMLGAAEQVIRRASGLWIPVVLHWEWEAGDDWTALRRLVGRLAPYAAAWSEFRRAVDFSSTDVEHG